MPPPLEILIVDDDDIHREALLRLIGNLGHHCRAARDGLEALEMHRAEHADVILSDWTMPRMDGIELCERTRAEDGDRRYTYFIIMTALGDKEHFLRGMTAGADDYQRKPIDIDELQARLTSAARVLGLYRTLAERNAVLRRDSQISFNAARVDPLTLVHNRLRMAEDLEQLFLRAQRYPEKWCAALADIDWFKQYNDRFGHLLGDDVLRRVAHTIREVLRESDAVYRYGGEEFLVLLPGQTIDEAVLAMERVRSAVEGLGIEAARGGNVTISVGVAALATTPNDSIDAWLRRADVALYEAKSQGRNRIHAAP